MSTVTTERELTDLALGADPARPVEIPKAEAPFKFRSFIEVKVAFPHIYPTTAKEPFTFYMRVQMVGDAEKLQHDFLMLPDTDQRGERLHEYDVEIMSRLSVKAPSGFPEFPKVAEGDEEALRSAIRSYFFPADTDEREGAALICRAVMSRYWRIIEPRDYL